MFRFFPKVLTLFIFSLFFAACSQEITGSVFLDKNGDNKQQSGEPNVAHLVLNVTLDDSDLELDDTPLTDADGNFSIPLKGDGTYCVEVPSDSLTASENDDGTTPTVLSLGRPTSSKALVTEAADTILFTTDTEDDCTDEEDNDSDGEIDCNDSDCSSTSDCPSTSSSPETNCTDDIDNDDDGDADCDDSDCDSDSSCDSSSDSSDSSSATTESGLACDDSTGFGLTLNIPIALDYSTGIDSLDDPATKTVSRGDTVTLSIVYPSSCTFDLMFLPLSIVPDSVPASSYDDTTGEFNLNTAADAGTVTLSDPLAINDDALATFDLDVDIVQDGSLESDEITITPTMTCPDDSTVTLKTHTIDVDSANDFTITQSMSGTQDYGETITVTTTITNNTSAAYDADQVELTLTTPSLTQNQTYDSSCSALGETASCTFDIAADEEIVLTTTFDIPDTLSSDTTFTMDSSLTLTSQGSSATFDADSVSFSVSASP